MENYKVIDLIFSSFNEFSESEKKVANYIINNRKK